MTIKDNLHDIETYWHLEEGALALLGLLSLLRVLGLECLTNGLIEDGVKTLLSERRALHVLCAPELTGQLEAMLILDWVLVANGKSVESLCIIAEVNLSSSEDDRNIGTVVTNFGDPLITNIVE